MAYIKVNTTNRLSGDIYIQGSKNSVLPIMAASLLNKGIAIIENVPDITDVQYMIQILQSLGCIVNKDKSCVIIDSSKMHETTIPAIYGSKLRSSVIFAGALLGRMGEAKLSYPGGCTIGKRPIDWHLKAFEMLGVKVQETDVIRCSTSGLKGTDIRLTYPSVGVTQNTLLAAVLAKGDTRIFGYARETEVMRLCEFLKGMGAKILITKECIAVSGVKSLHEVRYRIDSDRIVTGTYMAAVAAVGGEVTLKEARIWDNQALACLLSRMNVKIISGNDYVKIIAKGKYKGVSHIRTAPYPEFPTDMQPQIMAALIKADGKTVIEENVFEGRYKTAYEFIKMGADIKIEDKSAIITGVETLKGCNVSACDLRSGAALVIAGMIANGSTTIDNIEYIQRGYENIVRDLRMAGARIKIA